MNSRGFSLLEYIIYIGLSSIILLGLVQGMLLMIEARDKLSSIQPTQDEMRFTARTITRVIRSAESLNASDSVFLSDVGVLSLKTRDPSTSPTVFSLQDGTVLVSIRNGSPLAITSPEIIVEQLRFTNLSTTTGVFTVKIELRARSPLMGPSLSLETSSSNRQ